MHEAEPRQVVERYLAEVLGGSARSEELVAAETFRQRVDSFRAAFPDLSVTTRQVAVDGDLVGVHVTGHATHQGVFQGCPPTGRDWTAGCTAIYRVEAGRIAGSRVTWDLLAILEQLGGIERAPTVSA